MFDFKTTTVSFLATRQTLENRRVAEGEEIFFAGMMSQFYGSKRNYPVMRHGRVAMIPNEPVPTQDGLEDLYVAECQAFPGNSGSPVFLRLAPTVEDPTPDLYLLGLLKGHYYVNIQRSLLTVESPEYLETFLRNVGIAVVIPADKLHEILTRSDLEQHRLSQSDLDLEEARRSETVTYEDIQFRRYDSS